MSRYFIFCLFGILLTACQPAAEKETPIPVTNKTANISSLGWTLTYPHDWVTLSDAQLKKMNGRILETPDSEAGLYTPHYVAKIFWSINAVEISTTPLVDTLPQAWNITHQFIKQREYGKIVAAGIQIDTSATDTMQIDGQAFEVSTLYINKGDGMNLIQQYYTTQRKGQRVLITTLAMNPAMAEQINKIVASSSFDD